MTADSRRVDDGRRDPSRPERASRAGLAPVSESADDDTDESRPETAVCGTFKLHPRQRDYNEIPDAN